MPSLSPKSPSETRFVNSICEGLNTFFRNLPIMVKLVASRFEECVANLENTEGKRLEKMLDEMRKPYNLLYFIGLGQILNEFSNASVTSQGISMFPTSVLRNLGDL